MSNVYTIFFELNSIKNQKVRFYTFNSNKNNTNKTKLLLKDLKLIEFNPNQKSVNKLIKLIYE